MSVAPNYSSAAQKVLSLHELLTMILGAKRWTANSQRNSLQYILSENDLMNAMRVNRIWFDIASQELWASQDSIALLFHVPPARRQIYASMMTQISYLGENLELHHVEYRDIVFKSLKQVFFRLREVCTMRHIKPFLVPSLQSFHLVDERELQSEVFSQLARASPKVRDVTLSIHKLRNTSTFESFSRFIRHARFLKEVTVQFLMTNEAIGELLSSLAHSSSLERLQLSWLWTESQSQQLTAAVSNSGVEPFPKIAHMHLFVRSRAIDQLVPLVANLKRLTLTVNDSTDDVLPHVSNLAKLESLIIHYKSPCFIPRESLLGLGALSRLSTIHLCSCTYGTIGVDLMRSNLSDGDCEALARRLPNLHCLRLQLWCNISTKAVESFLRQCPSLEKCEFMQRLDTTDLFTSTSDNMIFPQLRKLCLGSLKGWAIMRSV